MSVESLFQSLLVHEMTDETDGPTYKKDPLRFSNGVNSNRWSDLVRVYTSLGGALKNTVLF